MPLGLFYLRIFIIFITGMRGYVVFRHTCWCCMAGRPSKRSKKRDDAYFDAIREGATIKKAAEIAGYSYPAVMLYKRDDDKFAEQHNQAMDYRFELYKEKAHEAMMYGFKEMQVIEKKGVKTTITSRKENPGHFKFMLKAHEAGTFNYEKINNGKNDELEDLSVFDIAQDLGETLKAFMDVEANDDSEDNT